VLLLQRTTRGQERGDHASVAPPPTDMHPLLLYRVLLLWKRETELLIHTLTLSVLSPSLGSALSARAAMTAMAELVVAIIPPLSILLSPHHLHHRRHLIEPYPRRTLAQARSRRRRASTISGAATPGATMASRPHAATSEIVSVYGCGQVSSFSGVASRHQRAVGLPPPPCTAFPIAAARVARPACAISDEAIAALKFALNQACSAATARHWSAARLAGDRPAGFPSPAPLFCRKTRDRRFEYGRLQGVKWEVRDSGE
jgi:hypothetical protein